MTHSPSLVVGGCVAAAGVWLVLGWPFLTAIFEAARHFWRETPAAAGKEA